MQRLTSVSLHTKRDKIFLISQLGFLLCIYISFDLWFPIENIYPSIPVFDFISSFPAFVNYGISALIVALLVLSIFQRFRKVSVITTLLLTLFIASFFDFLRVQPWVFYFATILLCFVIYKDHDEKEFLNVLRFIFACIYIWSGIQKLNFTFITVTYLWLMEPLVTGLPENIAGFISNTGIIVPALETLAGLGLFFKRTQKLSLVVLVSMHIFIVMVLGPLVHDTNFVILPWNIAFAIILVILFQAKHDFTLLNFLKKKISLIKIFIVLLFGVMPFFSFLNLWPMYFSSALYSSNKEKSEIFLPEKFVLDLPQQVQDKIDQNTNGLSLNSWTQLEVFVANYPNLKAHKKVFQKLCLNYPEYEMELILNTISKPDMFTGETETTTYFCDEVQNL